ncbi:DUF2087 domain-containing protein [Paradevosia shaoguanensis]|uniref:DUF2087 domain-containing protein n=1 Tax=Paradevosia shaoguanensis TaxID=1335043 RepID=A0AA41UD60_9HYPH|nr:DUF2087 domain-containing protein [Paradevosia shaoguanensis]MCF1744514.1 DUF2087 domain-containing protein [Paradevosia shaoguanensis]MCI0128997.1 DUF2087 domain-containing protein [Paradevosia shaoguanensis]
MSRPHIPFAVADVSAFAKSLRSQLAGRESLPSHVELLNMLAKAGGHRNFQHFRAGAIAGPMMRETEPRLDSAEVEQVLRHFDAQGRMMRWPGKTNHQLLCLWAIWARIPSGERFSEAEINAFINAGHSFGDHAILRRGMVDEGLLARTPDGRVYRRIEQVPPPEGQAVIREVLRRGTRE